MIQTIVSNARVPEYGQATISFPIREEDYPSVVNVLQRMGLGNPLERDCRVDEVIGDWPILKRLEKVAINLDEMDYLAKRLDSFDTQEKAKFQAAAVKYGLFDMSHLIDLTFCCQETTVITDFSDLEKVGRRHYLNVIGGSASREELENVDGYETALLLIGDGDGTITPYGVIYDNGMQLRPVYDGQNFPLYETLTDDPAVRKAADDLLLDFAGEENPRRACNYGMTEAGKQALREAADPDRPHTYAWFVMTDCNTPDEQIHRDLTLEDAVRLYRDSTRPEKRLGVTKDGIATVDFLREMDGEQVFFQDHRRMDSFRDDPVIFEAVQLIHRELEWSAPVQGMKMGGLK